MRQHKAIMLWFLISAMLILSACQQQLTTSTVESQVKINSAQNQPLSGGTGIHRQDFRPPSFRKHLPTAAKVDRIAVPVAMMKNGMSTSSGSPEYYYTNNVTDLINGSDAVVIAHPMQAFINRDHYVTRFSNEEGAIDSEWSEGSLFIDQVLSQRTSGGAPLGQASSGIVSSQISTGGLSAGQTVRFAEQVGVDITGGILTKTIIDDCYDLQEGSRYLLALFRDQNGIYVIHNLNRGRFNLDATDPFDDVYAIRIPGGLTPKRQLRNALIQRFNLSVVEPFPAPDSLVAGIPASTPGRPEVRVTYIHQGSLTTINVERNVNDEGWQPGMSRVHQGPDWPVGSLARATISDPNTYASGTRVFYRARITVGNRTSFFSEIAKVTVP